jgi:hypothetical protein
MIKTASEALVMTPSVPLSSGPDRLGLQVAYQNPGKKITGRGTMGSTHFL